MDHVDSRALWERNLRRSSLAIALSNALASVVVFVYLGYVVPTPVVASSSHARWLNAIVLAVFLAVVFPIGTVWSLRRARRMGAWMVARRTPTPEERDLILRGPFEQLKILAVGWGAGVVVFLVANLTISAALALEVAATVTLGGLVTCSLGYLLVERINRENTALALSIGPPRRPAAPGVGTRILLAWAIGTAVFVLALAALAVGALVAGGVSLERMSASVLFLSTGGLLVGLATMVVASRTVTDPLESVRSALREVEAGQTDVEVPVEDGSEIGLLQAGVNRMVAGLRERDRLHDLFGRHVGEDVARRALERGVELGGEVRDAAVLFVDIVGSTTLAASRPPDEVVASLNAFFGIVVDVIGAHSGWINKFEGDAALCVFGAPLALDDSAGCALSAGRELRDRLARELPELPAGIGISAGPVVAGNVGARERFEYTVIGDPVNEAARLTELAKHREARLLASEAVMERAGPDEAARWRLDGEVELRGRPSVTRVAVLR